MPSTQIKVNYRVRRVLKLRVARTDELGNVEVAFNKDYLLPTANPLLSPRFVPLNAVLLTPFTDGWAREWGLLSVEDDQGRTWLYSDIRHPRTAHFDSIISELA